MYSRRSDKNVWVLCLVMLSGILLGGFIGQYVGQLPYMNWLKYGKDFGLTQPLFLDLDIISIQFGFTIQFTISGILGMIIALLIYRKL